MNSTKPYLLRALHEWIQDNGCTPYLAVDADVPGVRVPQGYSDESGKITLNVSMVACRDLVIGNDELTFSARFGGRPFYVCLPMASIAVIYARENGRGMVFGPEPTEQASGEETPPPDSPPPPPKGRPSLKVVK